MWISAPTAAAAAARSAAGVGGAGWRLARRPAARASHGGRGCGGRGRAWACGRAAVARRRERARPAPRWPPEPELRRASAARVRTGACEPAPTARGGWARALARARGEAAPGRTGAAQERPRARVRPPRSERARLAPQGTAGARPAPPGRACGRRRGRPAQGPGSRGRRSRPASELQSVPWAAALAVGAAAFRRDSPRRFGACFGASTVTGRGVGRLGTRATDGGAGAAPGGVAGGCGAGSRAIDGRAAGACCAAASGAGSRAIDVGAGASIDGGAAGVSGAGRAIAGASALRVHARSMPGRAPPRRAARRVPRARVRARSMVAPRAPRERAPRSMGAPRVLPARTQRAIDAAAGRSGSGSGAGAGVSAEGSRAIDCGAAGASGAPATAFRRDRLRGGRCGCRRRRLLLGLDGDRARSVRRRGRHLRRGPRGSGGRRRSSTAARDPPLLGHRRPLDGGRAGGGRRDGGRRRVFLGLLRLRSAPGQRTERPPQHPDLLSGHDDRRRLVLDDRLLRRRLRARRALELGPRGCRRRLLPHLHLHGPARRRAGRPGVRGVAGRRPRDRAGPGG